MSRNRLSRLGALFLLFLLAAVVAACSVRPYRYSHYEAIDSEGWQRTDTLHFQVGPLPHDGGYAQQLGLRTTSHYPFMQLTLIVSQQAHPSGFSRTDTVNACLTDDDGLVTGEGISHYQYLYPLPAAMLLAGDTLSVSVRHDMLRSPLAGVTDVGFALTGLSAH